MEYTEYCQTYFTDEMKAILRIAPYTDARADVLGASLDAIVNLALVAGLNIELESLLLQAHGRLEAARETYL